jgi:hypothetical protein
MHGEKIFFDKKSKIPGLIKGFNTSIAKPEKVTYYRNGMTTIIEVWVILL